MLQGGAVGCAWVVVAEPGVPGDPPPPDPAGADPPLPNGAPPDGTLELCPVVDAAGMAGWTVVDVLVVTVEVELDFADATLGPADCESPPLADGGDIDVFVVDVVIVVTGEEFVESGTFPAPCC